MRSQTKITHHWLLDVYSLSVEAGMKFFHISKAFPKEETYALTDQGRRSSRSVSSHIAEGWRRRRYGAAFCDKLNSAESEAAETQVWIEYSVRCGYLPSTAGRALHGLYDRMIGKLVRMQGNPQPWLLPRR